MPTTVLSQSGFLIYLGNTLVAWSSKKQATVARSSTEAEYKAIAITVEELEAVMLTELGVEVKSPPNILYDNLRATFISQNPVCHAKLKHVAKIFHFT